MSVAAQKCRVLYGSLCCCKSQWFLRLERGADLHIAQLMLLPLTVSCFSKIQIGFTFLVPADPDSTGQWICVFYTVEMMTAIVTE